MIAAHAVKKASSLDLGPPKALFSARINGDFGYDVGKDGKFLIPIPEQTSSAPMTVVLNWQAALKK